MSYAADRGVRHLSPLLRGRLFKALLLGLMVTPSSLPSAYPIQGTFLDFYRNLTPELWSLEFRYMKAVGIKTVIIVAVGSLEASSSQALSCSLGGSDSYSDSSGYTLAGEGLLYPSELVSPAQRPAVDRLEMVFELADAAGMDVYLGSLQTATDWSDGTEFCALRELNQQVASEVIRRYGYHDSFKGWYFTQEIWMNWLKYFGQQRGAGASGYYGTMLMAEWAADAKASDSTKLTAASVVIKETGTGVMPGLTAWELQAWTTSLLQSATVDILMPQDGAGAGAGAPPLSDLPSYFGAMAAAIPAAGTNTALWSTVELFTASSDPGIGGEQYPPVGDISRVQAQLAAVHPFVSGYVSWMFGDDLSPQATYYPVEADKLDRRYRYTFNPESVPKNDVIPIQSYLFSSQQPDGRYPDSTTHSKLSDGTGGGYDEGSLTSWVGFSNDSSSPGAVQVVTDLGSVRVIHSLRALTQSWSASDITHPSKITTEVSADGVVWNPFGATTAFPPDTTAFAVMWGEVNGSASARYVRWTFTYAQWLFLAELEVIGPR